MIIFIDAFSRFTHILGLEDKSTNTVIQAMQQFAADHLLVTEFGYIDIGKVKADAGSQFSLESFKTFCYEQGLARSQPVLGCTLKAIPKSCCQMYMANNSQHGAFHDNPCLTTQHLHVPCHLLCHSHL